MKIRSRIAAAALGLGAAALLTWAFAPRPLEVETAVVARGRFEAGVDEDGKTRLRERYVVSAPLAGLLARINLREGDAVGTDDVVALLQPALSPMVDERTLREQQVRVEIAEAQLERVRARVDGARVGLQQARNEQQRAEQLARQGFVAATKLDNDRLAALAAQKELDAAVQEEHVARHEVEQARTALVAVKTPDRGRRFALRSPAAGRVLRVVQPSETTVALGTPLLEVGDTGALEVVAELLTADAMQVRTGSRVALERWGGGEALEGRVRLVEPAAFTKVSALGVEEQRVNVRIDITSPPERWRGLGDGYRVGVRILTAEADGVLKVPLGGVFPLPAGRATAQARDAVFVLDGGRARLVNVVVAQRNAKEAWLKAGVEPGTTVIVYPPAQLADGMRVKARHVDR